MFPRWLSWLFVLFLGYMLYAGYNPLRNEVPDMPKAPVKEEAARDYPAIRALIDGKRWAAALNPDYKPEAAPCAANETKENTLPAYAIIDTTGEGAGAACGDSIALDLTLWNNGARGKTTSIDALVLGEQPDLDALLLDIAPGETRTLFFTTPKAGYKTIPALPKARHIALTATRK